MIAFITTVLASSTAPSTSGVILSGAKNLCTLPTVSNFALFAADQSWSLFVCAILTAALVAYTFYVPTSIETGGEKTRLAYLKERKEQVYENLRDLNFEFKSGKFPESDYAQMRNALEDEAAALLSEIEQLEAAQKNPLYRGISGAFKKPNTKGARL